MDRDSKFAARSPKPDTKVLCGCVKKEDVDKPSGYFIWRIIKPCKDHKPHA